MRQGDDDMSLWRQRLILTVAIGALCASPPAPMVAAQPRELTFDVKIERGAVPADMRLIRVTQGDAVRLRFTTDRPITVHLHGYDIERRIVPGAVAEMQFSANATGRFPIEEHKPDAHGGHSHGEVLVRIEVYPR
jgi:hypothetical protein